MNLSQVQMESGEISNRINITLFSSLALRQCVVKTWKFQTSVSVTFHINSTWLLDLFCAQRPMKLKLWRHYKSFLRAGRAARSTQSIARCLSSVAMPFKFPEDAKQSSVPYQFTRFPKQIYISRQFPLLRFRFQKHSTRCSLQACSKNETWDQNERTSELSESLAVLLRTAW